MNVVIDYLRAVYPLSNECVNHLAGIVRHRHVGKKGFLLRPGEVCQYVWFIEKGMFRAYYMEGETEVTAWLRKEYDVIVSVDSYYDQVAATEYIQAVEDSEVSFITYAEEKELFDTFLEYNVIGRLLTQKELREHAREIRNIRMLTGLQRYMALLERDPDLAHRAPVMYLASYLGMQPESLSRVRQQLSK